MGQRDMSEILYLPMAADGWPRRALEPPETTEIAHTAHLTHFHSMIPVAGANFFLSPAAGQPLAVNIPVPASAKVNRNNLDYPFFSFYTCFQAVKLG
jgi:hypothetical protein